MIKYIILIIFNIHKYNVKLYGAYYRFGKLETLNQSLAPNFALIIFKNRDFFASTPLRLLTYEFILGSKEINKKNRVYLINNCYY